MGKYLRKSETSGGEVAVLEQSSAYGVRTRAKTLALQRDGGSYLQLRSRTLEKPKPKPQEVKRRKDPNLRRQLKGQNCNSELVVKECLGEEKKEEIEIQNENNSSGGGGEGSCGENLLEFEDRERTTRESTPCSLIRDPDNILTPGSSTRRNNASEASGRVPNSARRNIPTSHEMNDFFAGPEEKQQKQFIEKYNFDPVNDKPLPGRYEWEKLDR
ncbi:cyclin-dependent kinase inhibitor 4-like isoform X2 [Lycium barbarum]|uniref:cyclin-dependent kinase inhibitor 4-like isoform X1 n=1 Tax=Lycium barbarum TaxID=112863 RepID=UPI00293F3C80|nr:cyclin-dependent kinase inhibitor 4-like isoform X1 [Lycium barbarum]XP_060196319.1 cyclin-dependent kinase inhibitor 4-like isoform X2 [Lycium barbarum]